MKKVVYALWLGCSFSHVMGSLAIGFALCNSFCFAFVEVLFWGRQGSYIGWSMYSCMLGLVLVVPG